MEESLQVMTLRGPRDPNTFEDTTFFSHERLIFDHSKTYKSQGVNFNDAAITIGNIRDVHDTPTRFLKNVFMEDTDSITHEIRYYKFKTSRKPCLLDITTKVNGRTPDKLKQVADRCETDGSIIVGTLPDLSSVNLDPNSSNYDYTEIQNQLLGPLEVEIFYGKDGIFPGFLGEIQIEGAELSLSTKCTLEICFRLSAKCKIPIIISFGDGVIPETVNNILELSETHKAPLSRLAFYNLPITVPDFAEITNKLLSSDVYLGFDSLLYSQTPAECYPQPNLTFINMIKTLIDEGKTSKLLLATGLSWKMNFRKYAGDGLMHLGDMLSLMEKVHGVDSKHVWEQSNKNALALLTYWKAPPKVETVERVWKCDWCKKKSPESVEGFSKHEFQYCSIKCLSEHRKAGFPAVDELK